MNKKELNGIETLENAVTWDYLKRELSWPTDKIAYEMYLNERRLLEWINKRSTIITKLMKSEPGRIKAIRAELKKEYPLPKNTPRKRLDLNIIKIAKEHKNNKSFNQLAKKFKCDPIDFRRWWSDNLQIINQEYRKER